MSAVTKCFFLCFFKCTDKINWARCLHVSENRKEKQMIVTETACRLFSDPDLRC